MERFKVSANVILTFEAADDSGATQEVYDASVDVGYPENEADQQRFEIDVVKDLLAPCDRNKDDLVKISVCYSAGKPEGDENAADKHSDALVYLCRHNAKYYFQPDQRDPYEQAIAETLEIASKTRDFA